MDKCRRAGRCPHEPESILPAKSSGATVSHVAFYNPYNAGDTLLPVTVRDLIARCAEPIAWRSAHAHFPVDQRELGAINDSRGVIIGGGGLLLRDTLPGSHSGWQWNCGLDALRRIDAPLAVFAVGYNRFRGQEDFDSRFAESLQALVEKAVFVGLRNRGSMQSVREYLPEHLWEKIEFQPCPTTLLRRLYPDQFDWRPDGDAAIAVNCAFDRDALRFGANKDAILRRLAAAVAELGRICRVRYFAHTHGDEAFVPYLKRAGVRFRLERLYRMTPREIVGRYASCSLAIGMRGHAQMIPFGCGTPILSLISHDKVRWFLDDIGAVEWGMDLRDEQCGDMLVDRAHGLLDEAEGVRKRILAMQQRLWDRSCENAATVAAAMGLERP